MAKTAELDGQATTAPKENDMSYPDPTDGCGHCGAIDLHSHADDCPEAVMQLIEEYGELRSLATQQSNSRYGQFAGDTERRADAILDQIRARLSAAA